MDLLEMELTDEAAKKEKMDPANAKKVPEVRRFHTHNPKLGSEH